MRKCRLGVVLFFQEQPQHLSIQTILKIKVSLKLFDRGKRGKETFFLILALVRVIVSEATMQRCSLSWVFLKCKRIFWKIPVKDKKVFIFSNVVAAGLQPHQNLILLWNCKSSRNIFEQLPVCFSLWLRYIWFLRCYNEWLYEDIQFCFVFVM